MSRKEKWSVLKMAGGECAIINETGNAVIANRIHTKENADDIVQMHNSFDDLLEASKDFLKNAEFEELTKYMKYKIVDRLKSAIAKAEGE